MTPEQIEKLALEVAEKQGCWLMYSKEYKNDIIGLCTRFLAAYLKECGEPVGWLDGRGRFFYANDPDYSSDHEGMTPCYTHPATIPEGMVLVPIEPTQEMLDASTQVYDNESAEACYKAMISAARKEVK
jgi:hypothetical protein